MRQRLVENRMPTVWRTAEEKFLCETEARGESHAHSLEDSRGKVLLGLSVSLDGLR